MKLPLVWRVRLVFDAEIPHDGTKDVHDQRTYDWGDYCSRIEADHARARLLKDPPFIKMAKLLTDELIVSTDGGWKWTRCT